MSAVYIEVKAGVRYWEDAKINGVEDTDGTLTPFKIGEDWCPVIRLSDGVVIDWPAGTVASIHFKVCDAGEYWLLNEAKQRIAKWGSFYVPDDFLCPNENGYDDYIIMQIDENGVIVGWKKPVVAWACDCDSEDDSDVSAWKRIQI